MKRHVDDANRKHNAPPRRWGFASEIVSPHFSGLLQPLPTRTPLTYVPLALRPSTITSPVSANFDRMQQWFRLT
jgi:hypothetical protein